MAEGEAVTCETCCDKGLVIVNWTDAEPDYAVCLCHAAQWYRSNRNAGREVAAYGWQVWAARHQVEPSRVVMLEDVLTAEEMAECGLSQPAVIADREAVLLAAARKKVKL